MSSFSNPLTTHPQTVTPLAQKTLAAASVGASYTIVGTIFSSGVVLLYIISTLDQAVQLSFDGVTDHIPLLANSAIAFDFRSDNGALSGAKAIYAKQIGVPASGSIYVSAFTQ